jgi:hypothetical protein
MRAVQDLVQLNRDAFAIDRADPNTLTWRPSRNAKSRVAALLKSHTDAFICIVEGHVMPELAEYDRARPGKLQRLRRRHLSGNLALPLIHHVINCHRHTCEQRRHFALRRKRREPERIFLRYKFRREPSGTKAFVPHHGGKKSNIVGNTFDDESIKRLRLRIQRRRSIGRPGHEFGDQ